MQPTHDDWMERHPNWSLLIGLSMMATIFYFAPDRQFVIGAIIFLFSRGLQRAWRLRAASKRR